MYKGDTTVCTLLHVSMYSVVMSRGLMSDSMGNHKCMCREHIQGMRLCVIIIIREAIVFFPHSI